MGTNFTFQLECPDCWQMWERISQIKYVVVGFSVHNPMRFNWTKYSTTNQVAVDINCVNTFVNAVSNHNIKYSTWVLIFFKQVYTPLKPYICKLECVCL